MRQCFLLEKELFPDCSHSERSLLLLAVSFKGVPGFLLKDSMSVYCVEERRDSVARGSCPR